MAKRKRTAGYPESSGKAQVLKGGPIMANGRVKCWYLKNETNGKAIECAQFRSVKAVIRKTTDDSLKEGHPVVVYQFGKDGAQEAGVKISVKNGATVVENLTKSVSAPAPVAATTSGKKPRKKAPKAAKAKAKAKAKAPSKRKSTSKRKSAKKTRTGSWQRFVATHRKQGYSLKDIGKMWREAGHGAGATTKKKKVRAKRPSDAARIAAQRAEDRKNRAAAKIREKRKSAQSAKRKSSKRKASVGAPMPSPSAILAAAGKAKSTSKKKPAKRKSAAKKPAKRKSAAAKKKTAAAKRKSTSKRKSVAKAPSKRKSTSKSKATTKKKSGGKKRTLPPKLKAWQKHVAAYRAAHPGASFKDALKKAKNWGGWA